MADTKSSGRVDCLDGLRGLAALWVMVGHAHILSNFRVPVIGEPDLGVDLFIMLSGFLMVFHYQRRRGREPWEDGNTWRVFWIRRYFRIAPLYYVMLVAALTLGPFIYEARTVIDSFNDAGPQLAERYLDSSLNNYLLHLTFLFGFSPEYAFRTALPDWSIGLEMQFYLALPFIMLLVGRIGWLRAIAVCVLSSGLIAVVLKVSGVEFPMPTFLPLKLHVFAAGMLLAAGLTVDRRQNFLFGLIAAVLMLSPIGGTDGLTHVIVRVGLAASFFALIHTHRLPGLLQRPLYAISAWLGNRFFHQLGELSFGAYLIHLLIMQPVMAYLIKHAALSDPARWAVALIITLPVVYALSWLGYNFVEMPGQQVGKSLTRARAPN